MLPVQTILHAMDLSDCSCYAFHLACSLARDYNAKLLVISVDLPRDVFFADGFVPPPTDVDSHAIRQQLAHIVNQAALPRADYCLVQGDPVTEILRAADESKCDLIVMGTHGRTGLGRLVMGSVAEQVTRRAACPVLTVKTPQHQAIPVHPHKPATLSDATVVANM